MKYAAFDLEIAKDIPSGTEDWSELRPLGITCAGLATESGVEIFCGDGYSPQMSEAECKQLVYRIATLHTEGHVVVTWNGLQFDFDVLHEESQSSAILARLVPHHVDIGFAMLCEKGYMCGLNAAAMGMAVGEKTEGISGKDAPAMWKKGREEQDLILKYVGQDARITGLVYESITQMGYLKWIAKSGRPNKWVLPRGGIPTVREAMGTPMPNTSWMTKPMSREKCYKWMLALLAEEGLL